MADFSVPQGLSRSFLVSKALFEPENFLLENTEANYFSGPDFFEGNKCDPLFFFRIELKLDSTHYVRMYHKTFNYQHNTVFRVVATFTTLVLVGHTKILPAHIPNGKSAPDTINVVFELHSKISTENDLPF